MKKETSPAAKRYTSSVTPIEIPESETVDEIPFLLEFLEEPKIHSRCDHLTQAVRSTGGNDELDWTDW